ncbi:MAG: hypothetical protein K8T10_11265 [Candidatus Eremiobacteraeota bacterium]|nr:hypothetical protein [Candidatus Eremiobacteraeota bacterium]
MKRLFFTMIILILFISFAFVTGCSRQAPQAPTPQKPAIGGGDKGTPLTAGKDLDDTKFEGEKADKPGESPEGKAEPKKPSAKPEAEAKPVPGEISPPENLDYPLAVALMYSEKNKPEESADFKRGKAALVVFEGKNVFAVDFPYGTRAIVFQTLKNSDLLKGREVEVILFGRTEKDRIDSKKFKTDEAMTKELKFVFSSGEKPFKAGKYNVLLKDKKTGKGSLFTINIPKHEKKSDKKNEKRKYTDYKKLPELKEFR